ncbi:MAG: galactose-phosphate uridylyltransferase [Burkholderiales bacterium]|jgi:UDPglucose--hexose-1-phosphate uridylyltransferase|nr:galactose-phosphate uridylyltransferase [Burkholderiales bacterium]
MNIKYEIERLIKYALYKQLIEESDVTYIRNRYFYLLGIQHSSNLAADKESSLKDEIAQYPDQVLDNIAKYCLGNSELKLGNTLDIIKCNLMDVVTPRPSFVRSTFTHKYINYGITQAIQYFYQLSVASNYIKLADVNKNHTWVVKTNYGDLVITINLSKPEKDPKQIAQAKLQIATDYPKCLLCTENEGFAGDHIRPSRFTHRLIPLCLNDETWYFQFSPYVYYPEHSIIINSVHRDMQINLSTFKALFDFVDFIPEYIIGANTDIPIVGGSILNHDHFQAGNYRFPMENAKIRRIITWPDYPKVSGHILEWALSVISLTGPRPDLINLSNKILQYWLNYSDETVGILNYTTERHNALNPIIRKLDANTYQVYLILRNNRKSNEHPDGIFHPHQHLQHIKKENIGLIEAMGLAILPGRLDNELKLVEQILLTNDMTQISAINKEHQLWQHKEWLINLTKTYSKFSKKTIKETLNEEIGKKFALVLECSGVFKNNTNGYAAFDRFIKFHGGV